MTGPEQRRRLAALARRRPVRLLEEAARAAGTEVRLVGGAVRDTLLGRRGGDLDAAVDRARAFAVAEALAASAGTRVVPVGRPGRRVLHVPLGRTSVDLWELTGPPAEDLLRRDFTVNAIALVLPGRSLEAAPGALHDVGVRLLRPPRPGVFLEDPVRVLRAARFLATLPGFRIAREAIAELTAAATHLPETAPERRLAELDRILAAPAAGATRALAWLEARGALEALLPRTSPGERRAGLAALARVSEDASPGVRRVVFASGAAERSAGLLAALRAPRADIQLASWLHARGLAPGAPPARRAAVLLLREAPRPTRDALAALSASGRRADRRLAAAAQGLSTDARALRRIKAPRRLLSAAEVATLLGASGPALGRALEELAVATAAGEVASGAGARRHLLAWLGRCPVR